MKSIGNDMPILRKRRVSRGLAAEEWQGAKSSMHRKQGSVHSFLGSRGYSSAAGYQCSSISDANSIYNWYIVHIIPPAPAFFGPPAGFYALFAVMLNTVTVLIRSFML
jgi:hypothetical protein